METCNEQIWATAEPFVASSFVPRILHEIEQDVTVVIGGQPFQVSRIGRATSSEVPRPKK